MTQIKLETLGWNPFFELLFMEYKEQGLQPGRISLEHRNLYVVFTEQGEMPAQLTGRAYYDANSRSDLPAVGDWVALKILDEEPSRAVIQAVLPRKTRFSRKNPAKGGEQIVAANVDTVFIMVGLDGNYSVRRIERYLTMSWESGANPVVILTKADLCDRVEERIAEVEQAASGASVEAISVFNNTGLERFTRYLAPGKTFGLLGSSGVGKSTLLNYLLGAEIQRTQDVREFDSKGRHTTTHRQLFALPSGALVIDTPGMRELQLWDVGEGLSETFQEIEELAQSCRFDDCRHEREPGCAVRRVLESGELDMRRFENFRKMQKEMSYQTRKVDRQAELAEQKKWKNIAKTIKTMKKK